MSRTANEIMDDIQRIMSDSNVPQHQIDGLWLEWFRKIAYNIEPERLISLCKAEHDKRCFIQPCHVGDIIYILTTDAPWGIEATRVKQIRINKTNFMLYANCTYDDWGWAYWELSTRDLNKLWFTNPEAAARYLLTTQGCLAADFNQELNAMLDNIGRQITILEKDKRRTGTPPEVVRVTTPGYPIDGHISGDIKRVSAHDVTQVVADGSIVTEKLYGCNPVTGREEVFTCTDAVNLDDNYTRRAQEEAKRVLDAATRGEFYASNK